MARPKANRTATRSQTTTTAAGRSTDARDRTVYTHNLWLNYLKPVSLGLVVSPGALRLAQVELSLQSPDAQNALLNLTVPRPPSDDDDPDANLPARILPDLRAFLTGYFGWEPELLEVYAPGPQTRMYAGQQPAEGRSEVPEALRHPLPQYEDTLEPSFAYRWRKPEEAGATYAILGLEVAAGVDLDRKPNNADDGTWQESPQKKFERLLYETGIPIGLIVQDAAVRLVYRPESQQSGYITFPLEAILKPAGRLACSALRSLLSHQRIHLLPSRQRLGHILAESRRFQNEVSTELAEQVLAALFELLKGFEAADEESRGRLLAGIRDRDAGTNAIYEGCLTVLMRLVFLLYAEEREMFPADELFARNYSIAGLFARLVEEEGRHPDTMDQRYGAWAHLISLFRVVYFGMRYDGPDGTLVQVPERKGNLFDYRRFGFLEGRTLTDDSETRQPLPKVSDGTVLRVLRNLLYLGQERLSYRSLEVEQIGSVYEAVMGYRVEAAAGRSVAIRPEKRGGAPVTVNLDHLLGLSANARVKWFSSKQVTDRKLSSTMATEVRTARSIEGLVAALDRLIDKRLTPNPVPAGSLVIQPSAERRRSGSHYTPRSLTGPIVTKALGPVLERLGENPKPEDILALKVCDPAMGSGAFLVETMRQLAKVLVESWGRHGRPPRIPKDETPLLHASRLIAQRCLYGVDRNRMAVDLAKLSLWLATLAKDHAFSFLDHNFRHGDSLVGLSLAQIQACHWTSNVTSEILLPTVARRIGVVMQERAKILNAKEWTSYHELTGFHSASAAPLEFVRFLGAAILGVFFDGGTATAKERTREQLSHTIRDYVSPGLDMPTAEVLRREIAASASVLNRQENPVIPFHWEVEFPEVFLETSADGTLNRRDDGGFHAMVGNPPFMGGRKIRKSIGVEYLNWLTSFYPESRGNADLVAFFFRRAFDLLRPAGTFGLIATNTIGQGDTRSTGLRWICTHGGVIYEARKRLKWPGEAAVVVSVVHVFKARCPDPIASSTTLSATPNTPHPNPPPQGGREQDAHDSGLSGSLPPRAEAPGSESLSGSLPPGGGGLGWGGGPGIQDVGDLDEMHQANGNERVPCQPLLDGRSVPVITAYLFHAGGHDDPARLHANAGKSFQGSIVLGMGFTFDDTDKKGKANPITRERAEAMSRLGDVAISMEELISTNPINSERIFPYIGGDEINNEPQQSHHRYVINFENMTEIEAQSYEDLWKLIESTVKPERTRRKSNGDFALRTPLPQKWWIYADKRPALYAAIRDLEGVLACSQTSKYFNFAFLPNHMVYTHKTIVFPTSSRAFYSLLQCSLHQHWSEFQGSSLEDRPVYTPTDCFETFPFPPGWETDADLERIGKAYYDYRAKLMVDTNKGLTKTYNRFHDPKEKSAEIVELRRLHGEMDRAVLARYGWDDVNTTCGFDLDWCDAEAADDADPTTVERLESGNYFFPTAAEALAFASELIGGGKSLPWRYRWPPHVRDDLLARLLLLNKERAAAERLSGLSALADDDDDLLDTDEPTDDDEFDDDDDA
jgi:hypothetical protein